MNPREEYSLSSQKLHAQKTLSSSSSGELLSFYREFLFFFFSIRDSSVPGSPCFRDFRCHFLAMRQTIPCSIRIHARMFEQTLLLATVLRNLPLKNGRQLFIVLIKCWILRKGITLVCYTSVEEVFIHVVIVVTL